MKEEINGGGRERERQERERAIRKEYKSDKTPNSIDLPHPTKHTSQENLQWNLKDH